MDTSKNQVETSSHFFDAKVHKHVYNYSRIRMLQTSVHFVLKQTLVHHTQHLRECFNEAQRLLIKTDLNAN